MEVMGWIFTVLLVLLALAAIVTTLMNLDDIRRYLHIKRM